MYLGGIAINICFRHYREQVELYHRNLLDEIKTLGFLVIIFSFFMLES